MSDPEQKKGSHAGQGGSDLKGGKNSTQDSRTMDQNYNDSPEDSRPFPEEIEYFDRSHGRNQAEAIGATGNALIFREDDAPMDPFTEAEAIGKVLARDTEERCLYLIEHGLIHSRAHKDLLKAIRQFISENGHWDEIRFAVQGDYPEGWGRTSVFNLKDLHGDHDGNGKADTWDPTIEILRDVTRRRGLYQLANQVLAYSKDKRSPDALDLLERSFNRVYSLEESYQKPDQNFIQPAGTFIEKDIPEAPTLIDGILRRGEKLIISGPSKAGKSWALIDMFLSMGGGTEFWGKPCSKANLLFINLELRPKTMQRRLCQVMREKERLGMDPGMPPGCHVMNMREWIAANPSKDPFEFVEAQVRRSRMQFDGIFLDPFYKLYGKRSENDLSDMAELWGRVEALGNSLDAAMLISHHFAKGSASAKDHIDRAAGSGGHAREVDAFITMSPHEDDGCYTIEATFRDWAPMPSFVVEWEWPLMTPVDKDPSKLRGRGGPSEKLSIDDLVMMIPPEGITRKELEKQALDQYPIVERTFRNKLKKAMDMNRICVSKLNEKLLMKP